jgi:hypothetical protein
MDDEQKVYKAEIKYGIQWYKVRERNSGINEELLSMRDGDLNKFLVKRHHPTYGQYWGLATFEQIKKMIQKNVYLYEILTNGKKKVYFDIDSKTDTLEECKKRILEKFPNARLQISGYRSELKHSYHIVLSNYFVNDSLVIKHFAGNNTDIGFDTAVYGRNNLFKCINQSKPKKDALIQAYLEGDIEVTKHLVMYNFDDDAEEVNSDDAIRIERRTDIRVSRDKAERKKNEKKPLDLLNDINPKNKNYELPEDFDYINAFAHHKLKVIPLNHRDTDDTINHTVIWKVMVWAKNENISFENFWDWCKQKEDTETRKLRYADYWAYAEKYFISETFIDTLLFRFYPFLKENDYRRKYRMMNTITPTRIITNEYLSKEDISSADETPITYLTIRMGGNKTGAVIDFLKEETDKNPDAKVLFLTPRIALSQDILGRMEREGLKFVNYKDIKNKSELKWEERLICSVQSLHYLADTKFDYVVIDEIETVWPSFSGDAKTHHSNVNANWALLLRMVETAKKTIIMDALMSMKTLKIFGQGEVISLEKQQEERKYIEYRPTEIHKWFDSIHHSLKNGEKIIIFMPYKDSSKTTDKRRHELSGIAQIIKWICHEFKLEEGKDVIGYFAEAKEEKQALVNIEEIWKKARCIVANTCIAVGNNYGGEDFDKIYAYFSHWLATNDFLQFLYRVRNPKDKTMRIYYEQKRVNLDKVSYHKVILDNDKFKYLRSGFLVEERTDSMMKLEVLMDKLNIIKENIKESEIPEMPRINFDDFKVNYSDIPKISYIEYKRIAAEIDTGFSSLIQRFSFEKYRLESQFKDNTPEIILEMFWNIGETVLKGLRSVTNNNNHLLNKILNELGHPEFLRFIESYTDRDLCLLKVPKCITNDKIKENITLRNPIENRDIGLVARIINAIFGKRVIGAVRDKQILIDNEGNTKCIGNYEKINVLTKRMNLNGELETTKTNVIKYAFENIKYSKENEIEFEELCKYYKEYSNKYDKEVINKVCLIEDDCEIIEDIL